MFHYKDEQEEREWKEWYDSLPPDAEARVEHWNRMEWQELYDAQWKAYKSGAEIDPPWIVFSDTVWRPWNFKQGVNESWKLDIWIPFWDRLSREEQIAYLDKWIPPPRWRDGRLRLKEAVQETIHSPNIRAHKYLSEAQLHIMRYVRKKL